MARLRGRHRRHGNRAGEQHLGRSPRPVLPRSQHTSPPEARSGRGPALACGASPSVMPPAIVSFQDGSTGLPPRCPHPGSAPLARRPFRSAAVRLSVPSSGCSRSALLHRMASALPRSAELPRTHPSVVGMHGQPSSPFHHRPGTRGLHHRIQCHMRCMLSSLVSPCATCAILAHITLVRQRLGGEVVSVVTVSSLILEGSQAGRELLELARGSLWNGELPAGVEDLGWRLGAGLPSLWHGARGTPDDLGRDGGGLAAATCLLEPQVR